MKITDNPKLKLWESIVNGCHYATFFHTPTWARILEKTYPFLEVATKAFIFDDGTQVVLPLMKSEYMKGIIYNYSSMPFTLYGGIVADKKIGQEKIHRIFSSLAERGIVKISITGNPLYSYNLPGKYNMTDYFTQVLELDRGFDYIWSNFSKGHKSSAKKSEKEGVSIRLADRLEEYREYYSIYLDSVRRWGNNVTSFYGFEIFKNIFEMGSDKAKLWLAYFEGVPIAGALFFYHNRHVAYWSNASLEDYFKYCPNNLLHVEAIKHACESGYEHYDFLPSGRHEGVVRFKKSFGAMKRNFRLWHFGNPRYVILSKVYSFVLKFSLRRK